jgi:disulfide bond formation protein DsbB
VLDDLLVHLFGHAVFGRYDPSARTRLLVRLAFGLLGAALGVAGAVHVLMRAEPGAHLRLATAALLLSFGSFWLLNVGLARTWRWPGVLTLASLIALLGARLLLGA